jgi:2-oxo-hept-3-ene-1,7-dioate hydratase
MEHPIGRAMWLARTLKAAGITVKAGDVLSLGSYAGPVVPPHGKHVTLMYAGLPGNPSVTVYFE